MKLATCAVLTFLSLTHGYVLQTYSKAGCSGAARSTIDLNSDDKCTGIDDTQAVQYQSDIGCVLSTYDSTDCGGKKAVTGNQNSCFIPGYKIRGVICN